VSWVSVEQTRTLTGTTATDDDLAAALTTAQAVVELHVGRTLDDSPNIAERDLRTLAQAVAWQAVWLLDQPGYTARSLVEQVTQEAQSTTFAAEQAVTLAPLTIVALRKLSWRKPRTISAGGPA
jgi:hypothetical protein